MKVIDSSSLPEATKLLYRQIADKAAEGTNGLSKEDKLQNVSETCFSLTELNITRDCKSKEEYDLLFQKLDSISKRLEKNDEITNSLNDEENERKAVISTKIEEISKKLGNIEEYHKTEAAEPTTPRSDRSWVELAKDLFTKIGWPGAFTIVGVIGIIALRPEIIAALKHLFQ